MIVIDWDSLVSGAFVPQRSTAMTIGVFDGVHRGHRALLNLVSAKKVESIPTAVTFRSNPKAVLRPKDYEGDILSLDQKLEALASAGAELVILIDFSGNFGKLAGKEFIGLLKDRGKLRYLAVGSDFRCGHRLDTDAAALKRMNEVDGISTDILDSLVSGGAPVSSSRIRAAIAAGDLVEATALLGRNVELDLDGTPTTPGAGWVDFDVRAARRIAPPNGRYPAILVDRNSSSRSERFVDVTNGVVRVPTSSGVLRVELLPLVAQGE
jgi:riboflavin kinase / FMN adenylyltransferase